MIDAIVILAVGMFLWGWFKHSPPTHNSDPQLLICSTSHTRFFPVRHSFTYPLLYVFLRINKPFSNVFFALDKWRLFSIRTDDYLGSPPCGPTLMDKLYWHLDQHVQILNLYC
jgi:DUF1365 family protein